ncbi:Sad1 / UNC-like C-terminal domain containing protein [Lactarius tabidus]|jgi:SUN domain-containing protein 1/2
MLVASAAAAAAAAFLVLAVVFATTGGLCIEVVLRANPLIGVRIFTEKFDRPDGPCFAHAVEIGRLKAEASFGSWSHLGGAVDYANVAKGGQSIPALTSPLYSHPVRLDLTRVDKAFWKSFGPRPVIHPPEMALSGDTSPGQCWAFAGHTGQLGIQLPDVVRVTSFTVEHTGNSSLIDSAPRNIILWGLIPKDTNDVPLSSLTRTYDPTGHTGPQFGALHTGIPLASATFDAVEGQPRQTFPVRCRERHRTFDSLLAQFEGNWGHPDFTCLYRFEINGEGKGLV